MPPCASLKAGGSLIDHRFEPEAVIAALNRAGVRYVVVGGLAVGAHGVVRATRDLDLVPAPETENFRLLASVLTGLGARHPIQDELTADNLKAPASIQLVTSHGEVHVLNRMPGTPPFAELAAQAVSVALEADTTVSVCSLAHLRRMKRASARPRDRVDLEELHELHGPG